MKPLLFIKLVHTFIWICFNIMLAYLMYAVTTNKITQWVWIGLSAFVVEGLVLLLFRNNCPLTLLARKYSASVKDNFDIFLPNWLARNNKLIYTVLLSIVLGLLVWRLIERS